MTFSSLRTLLREGVLAALGVALGDAFGVCLSACAGLFCWPRPIAESARRATEADIAGREVSAQARRLNPEHEDELPK